jgi:hypothetical protein
MPKNRLCKLRVDEVSAVTKGANGKSFLILKTAKPPKKQESPPRLGWIRDTLRKLAGTSGPNTEVQDMTADEIKKAVEDSLSEGLAPIVKRLEALETPTEGAAAEPTPVVKAEDAPPAAEVTAEDIAKLVGAAVSAAIEPLAKRLETVEAAAGQRQSGLEEGGAHVKKADGTFSWQGSGLLL